MDRLILGARWALGLVLLIGGINGFFTFVPVPEFHPFMAMLIDSGFLYVVKALEIIAALLLLSNRYVLLALTIMAPIAVNILLFHLFFDPRGWPLGVLVVGLTAFLIGTHWQAFRGLLAHTPDT